MQCEICGIDIKGVQQKIILDSSKLGVCIECVKYGTLIEEAVPVKKEVQKKLSSIKSPSYSKKKSYKIELEELIEDYHLHIIDARKSHNMTQEQLASKIKEKVTLIKKIERNDIIPEDSVRKKIEKVLNIKLTEGADDFDWKNTSIKKSMTLEDLVTIKK